jgi:site-specific recombinase XerD
MELKAYLEKNYSQTSIYNYEKAIARYLLYMQGEAFAASEAAYPAILNYIAHLRKQKLHPKTVKNHLFAIKIYYNYLIDIHQREDHPCKTLYLKDQINRSIHVESLYSLQNMELYLEQHQSKNNFLQKRDQVIISLLIYQALTTHEIVQLKLSDIDLEKAIIIIQSTMCRRGQNQTQKQVRTLALKPHQIMLFHQYIETIRAYLLEKHKTETDLFLVSARAEGIKSAGINSLINQNKKHQDKMSPQKIRQSVIANLLKQNNDIRMVQAFAGHKRIGTTESYKQSGLEALKASIEQLHPLQ